MKKLLPVLIVLAAGGMFYVWKTRGAPTYVAPALGEQATAPRTLSGSPAVGECVRVLDLSGMCCGGCPPKLQQALAAVPGVREAVVDFEAKTASVIAPEKLALTELESAATFDDYRAVARR